MEEITEEQPILTVLHSKIPPAIDYLIKAGSQVCLFREQLNRLDGPFMVVRGR